MVDDDTPAIRIELLPARLGRLPDPALDVVLVTPIDSDHIGGNVPFLYSPFVEHVGDVWFNHRTPRTEPWDDPGRRDRYGYRTAYPSDPDAGVARELAARP